MGMFRTLAAVLGAAGLSLAVLAQPATAAAAEPTPGPAPVPTTCRLVDFDTAVVFSRGPAARPLTLVVSGQAPASNYKVTLEPVVYVQQPDFWEIDVVGCAEGIGLPVLTPYKVSLDITNTVGTRGIVVVGSNKAQRILIPGGIGNRAE